MHLTSISIIWFFCWQSAI